MRLKYRAFLTTSMQMKTIAEIRGAIVRGKKTARQVVEETLADIKLRDGAFGAFLETFDADALKQADAVDALRAAGTELPALAGVPIAIKDNLLYKGHVASAGSRMLAEYTATYTATVVERLIVAGAVIIGRTNMDEFAMGSSTETSAFKKTLNPWNTAKIPGGSSGGSAVAVAAGFVAASLGTDTGGSIRQPASLCGVVGLKPTYGRVSRFGAIAMASSLDQIGPFASNVADAALVLSVIEGYDERDATSMKEIEAAPADLVALAVDVKGLRIGVPKEYFADGLEAGVRTQIESAIAKLKEAGAVVSEISLPMTKFGLSTYYIIQPAETSSNLGRYDGLRYGTRAPGALEESYLASRSAGFGPEVKRRIMLGTFILSAGYIDAFYKKAIAVRNAIRADFEAAFKDVDVILGPTSPLVAWDVGKKMDDPLAMYLADIFTVSTNIAGIAGISIPCGLADGLPVGLQLQGKFGDDPKLLAVAHAIESIIA